MIYHSRESKLPSFDIQESYTRSICSSHSNVHVQWYIILTIQSYIFQRLKIQKTSSMAIHSSISIYLFTIPSKYNQAKQEKISGKDD